MIHAAYALALWEKGSTLATSVLACAGGCLTGVITFVTIVDENEGILTVFSNNSNWQKKALAVISTLGFLISSITFSYSSFILATHFWSLGLEATQLVTVPIIVAFISCMTAFVSFTKQLDS